MSWPYTGAKRIRSHYLSNVTFVETDLAGYFCGKTALFETIVSTYVAHHLTESEKHSSKSRKLHSNPESSPSAPNRCVKASP